MSDWHNIHTVKVQYEEVALEENANDIRSSFNFSSKLKGKICILIGSQILFYVPFIHSFNKYSIRNSYALRLSQAFWEI